MANNNIPNISNETVSQILESGNNKRSGRPCVKTDFLCAKILKEIGENYLDLKDACRKNNITPWTWLRWCAADAELNSLYTRAFALRADALSKEIEYIARESSNDRDDILRRRLLLDTLKWRVGKLYGKYAERINIGIDGGLEIKSDLSSEFLNNFLKKFENS